MQRNRALLVFARNPIAGKVKTRLIPAIGAEGAVTVYRQLLAGTLAAARETACDTLSLWIDEAKPSTALREIIGDGAIDWHPQHGANLGERMHHAVAASLTDHRRAVLIGSDCPEFSADYLERAFDALRRCDVVIGPATDGGYVLIGMNTLHPGLFDRIPWSTDRVLATTRQRVNELNLSCHELPALSDIDTIDDLNGFAARQRLACNPGPTAR